jgi:GntR family transcriptional regulator
MFIKIDQQSGIPIYLQIMQEIKKTVAFGGFKAGNKLPSVRELAVQLRVNPNTVARAYRELQYDKIIESRWGGGNFIASDVAKIAEVEKEKIVTDKFREALKSGRELGFNENELQQILTKVFKEKKD